MFVADIMEVRTSHKLGIRSNAVDKLESLRAVLTRLDSLRFRMAREEIIQHEATVNSTWVAFPSTHYPGTTIEALFVESMPSSPEVKPLVLFIHAGGMALGVAKTVEVSLPLLSTISRNRWY